MSKTGSRARISRSAWPISVSVNIESRASCGPAQSLRARGATSGRLRARRAEQLQLAVARGREQGSDLQHRMCKHPGMGRLRGMLERGRGAGARRRHGARRGLKPIHCTLTRKCVTRQSRRRAWMRCTSGESDVSQRSRRSSATSLPRANTRCSPSAASRRNSGCAPSCARGALGGSRNTIERAGRAGGQSSWHTPLSKLPPTHAHTGRLHSTAGPPAPTGSTARSAATSTTASALESRLIISLSGTAQRPLGPHGRPRRAGPRLGAHVLPLLLPAALPLRHNRDRAAGRRCVGRRPHALRWRACGRHRGLLRQHRRHHLRAAPAPNVMPPVHEHRTCRLRLRHAPGALLCVHGPAR